MSKNRAAIVTGGGGYLGKYFINGLSNNYSTVYVVDKNPVSKDILKEFSNISLIFHELDISKEKEVIQLFKSIEDDDSESIVTTLLNAAANNPKITSAGMEGSSRFESFSVENFSSSVSETLLGTTLMCREFVKYSQKNDGDYEKIILNIGSDLSVLAPDNRIYGNDKDGNPIFKPIEYSISKHGIVGLTKYLAVYLAGRNFRVNCLSPTGVLDDQDQEFINKFSKTVPMDRMLNPQELISHITYLTSSDSQFLTGQNILVDGGRSIW